MPDPSILFFDGVCTLCNATIDFLIRRDHHRLLRYAPLQGATSDQILRGEVLAGRDPDSIVLFQRGKLHRRSGAVLRALAAIGGFWRISAVFLLIPWPIRDLGYNFIARHRYQWFGRRDTCRLPTPEERELFLP